MKFKTKPYKHQLECLNKFGNTEAFALNADMGTGKTWIIINNAAQLWLDNKCDGLLVFAPNGVHTNWTRLEIPQHMPDEVSYVTAVWKANPRKKEKIEIEGIYAENSKNHFLRIFTMNWEALQTKKGVEAAERFAMSCRKLMIACDESDSYKTPSAKRTKNLMRFKALWRRNMTGTPVNNSPFDLFTQYNFLDKNILGITNFYAFKARYAEMLHAGNALVTSIMDKTNSNRVPQIVARGPGGRPKYKNLDKLAALIEPHTFRVLKEDCLDLPDKIYKTILFDLTPEQKVIYRKAKVECRLAFEDNETPFSKLTAVTKLAQITSGYYKHPLSDNPVRIDGDNLKLNLLIEWVKKITDQGNKIIIWARYRIEIADIVARLQTEGITGVQYHGGIKTKAREEAIDEFQNGDVQTFVGNPQAGGMGITLTAANYVIYFSNDFSYRNRAQSEDRAHRIGQKKNVTYINLAAQSTIDEHVIRILLSKKDVSAAIIDRGLEMLNGK